MGQTTSIAWTGDEQGRPGGTFNPWIGCEKVSPACKNCYAEEVATKRLRLSVWGAHAPRHRTAASTWAEPRALYRKATKEGRRIKVFCASLADVFEPHPQVAPWRADLFRLIEETGGDKSKGGLDYLLLTKRPEHALGLAEAAGWKGRWPDHVWAGTTVESQPYAERRIPELLLLPTRIHFLSCEPLLGPLDLSPWLVPPYPFGGMSGGSLSETRAQEMWEARWGNAVPLDWIICGGESGHGARPLDLAWARSLRDQCQDTSAAFFMKQMGDNPILSPGPLTWPSTAPKGGDPAEWPEDLRVQQFPAL